MKRLQDVAVLSAGDKIRFQTKEHGLFIAYVNRINSENVDMKGCKLVEPHASMHDLIPLDNSGRRAFPHHKLLNIEVIEPAPF